MDDENLARILEETEEKNQIRIVDFLQNDRILRVFSYMSKDDIVDILGEINFGGYLDKELKESDFFKSEKNWHQIHKKLFKEFKLLKSNSLDRLPKSIEYTDRLYYIDYSCSNIYDKYKLKKRKEVLHNLDSSIKNFEPSTNLQLEFKYE